MAYHILAQTINFLFALARPCSADTDLVRYRPSCSVFISGAKKEGELHHTVKSAQSVDQDLRALSEVGYEQF